MLQENSACLITEIIRPARFLWWKVVSTIKDFVSINTKYDPAGNRIFKDSSQSGQRKYIVDIAGDLPVILMELNNSGDIVKTYIYANSRIIAQLSSYLHAHKAPGKSR